MINKRRNEMRGKKKKEEEDVATTIPYYLLCYVLWGFSSFRCHKHILLIGTVCVDFFVPYILYSISKTTQSRHRKNIIQCK